MHGSVRGELSPQHNPPKSAHSTFTSVAFHEVDNNGTFTRSVADVTLKSNNIRIDIATNAKKKVVAPARSFCKRLA